MNLTLNGYTAPSGFGMLYRQRPPGFASHSWVVLFGTHHFSTCSRSVNAAKTVSRGASNFRVTTISLSAVVFAIILSPFGSCVDIHPGDRSFLPSSRDSSPAIGRHPSGARLAVAPVATGLRAHARSIRRVP